MLQLFNRDGSGHFEDESILLLCKEVSRINLIHEISLVKKVRNIINLIVRLAESPHLESLVPATV